MICYIHNTASSPSSAIALRVRRGCFETFGKCGKFDEAFFDETFDEEFGRGRCGCVTVAARAGECASQDEPEDVGDGRRELDILVPKGRYFST
jgi:hypothetical protein